MGNGALRLTRWEVLLHAFAGVLVALVLWTTGLLDSIEKDTYDLRVTWNAKPSRTTSSVIIARLDQESLDHIEAITGQAWPWPREFYGSIIDNCRRRGAVAIGFDVTFTDDSWAGVKDDDKFAAAIRAAPSFALGSVFPTKAMNKGGVTGWPEAIPRPRVEADRTLAELVPSYERAIFPLAVIVGPQTVLANIQHQPDSDGIYRSLHPLVFLDGEPLPALGVAMYLAAHPDTRITGREGMILLGNDKKIPIDEDGASLLRFRGPSGTFPWVHASSLIYQELKILSGEMDPEDVEQDLEGKYVLFGFTAPALYDVKTGPTGKTSGPEINATLLDNLLAGDFITPLPSIWMFLSALVLSLFSTLSISFLPSIRSHLFSALFSVLLPPCAALLLYRSGYNFTYVPVQLSVAFSTGLSLFRSYSLVHGRERFIKHSFKHYLSPVVIDQLLQNPERLRLGGERKELTLFFSDLAGFTTLSEGLTPEELTNLLNEYLTAMTDIILDEKGTVDKFEGDAIIAFWNAPLDIDDHAVRAVRAALRCQEKLAALRPVFRQKYGHDLHMRIGINTGHAIVGNMGSSSRFDYSVLGDAVNLAARLEGANKYFGTRIMISETTRRQIGDAIQCRELGRLRVAGRKEPVTVYEPLPSPGSTGMSSEFANGLKFFYQGNFSAAVGAFNRCFAEDPAAAAYLDKCRLLMEKEVKEWEGVWELDGK
ncbi:MAG: adenylate/guanylate cyclase domain-containing protein [Desulfobulbaceae bacterium]